jgi:uncharacterized protein YecA (UPF0149 family)
LIAIQKYGAGLGSSTSWRMDHAVEKFEDAYQMAPDVPYFAARVHAIRFTAATGRAYTDERRPRFDEAARWWKKAIPYYREHAPWALEPGSLDTQVQEYPETSTQRRGDLRHTTDYMKGRDRNSPCPCGSGKKFKKCCGRSTA